MIEINIDSDAGRYLVSTFKNAEVSNLYKLRMDIRADGLAFKINEGMWTPTLMTEPRRDDDNPALKYHRC